MLTHNQLKSELHYDPSTGVFTWILCHHKSRIGKPAGTSWNGYIYVTAGGRRYPAHRLAWFYVYGHWPELPLDHENDIKTDNRISNLRQATFAQNAASQPLRKCNTTGFKGVSRAGKRWVAQATYNKRTHYLGRFDSPQEANAAYNTFAKASHGVFFHE